MALTEENKKHIINELLRDVDGVSDKAYQKRVWINAEGPEWMTMTKHAIIFSLLQKTS